jgi:hypothetical protein
MTLDELMNAQLECGQDTREGQKLAFSMAS